MNEITCTDCNETATVDDDCTLCDDCASSAYDIYVTID